MSSNSPPLTVWARGTSAAHQSAQPRVSITSGTQPLHLPARSQQKSSLSLWHANYRQAGHFNSIKDQYQTWLSRKETDWIPCVHWRVWLSSSSVELNTTCRGVPHSCMSAPLSCSWTPTLSIYINLLWGLAILCLSDSLPDVKKINNHIHSYKNLINCLGTLYARELFNYQSSKENL